MTHPQQFRACPFCAEEIKVEAIKCKHCHTDLVHSSASSDSATPLENTRAAIPVRRIGFLKGLCIGVVVGVFSIGLGILLCLTIIGMILGFPLIFLGIGSILVSPFLYLVMREGNCPYCQQKVTIVQSKGINKCRSCKNRFSIRGGFLDRIPK